MKLDVTQQPLNSRANQFTDSKESDWRKWQQAFQPNTWVHLLERPSPFSFDEALLLCQLSESEWSAWIPDCGEAVLHVSQFC